MPSPRPSSPSLSGIAIIDTPVTSRVRIRSWRHRFGPTEFPAGAHAEVEVSWVLEGQTRYQIEDRELVVEAGQGAMIPARTRHATLVSPGVVAGSAWIAPEIASRVSASLGRRPSGVPVLLPDASEIVRIGGLLESEAKLARAGQSIVIEALIDALWVAVTRAEPSPEDRRASRDARIAAALELLETRYSEPLGVDDLSRAAGLSRFHFSRRFREETGMSPYRYLQRIRIARAHELLASGHGVTDAALSVGFRDLGRFARAFREQVGMTPSAVSQLRDRRDAG
jgi:AraC-like DNA-binding protein